MDKEQLATFLTLVTYKNFTKTAEMLHVAQSTVSARLKSLEEALGKPLFTRNNKEVELTPSGQTFLPYAKRIFELMEESKKEVSLDGHFVERLVIGGPSSAWNYIFRNALSTFVADHIDVSLELKTHSSENTISKVIDGVIDIGIAYTKPTHPKLHIQKHLEDEYRFVSSHPLGRPITKDDLHSKDFLLNNWGDTFFEWFMQLTGANYLPAFSINQTAILLNLLEERNYFSLLPSLIAQPLVNSGKLYYLEHDFQMPSHHIYIFTARNVNKELTVQKMLGLLENEGQLEK